jgi:hypothetical protein
MANRSPRRGGIAVKSQPETGLVSRGSCHGCGQTIGRARVVGRAPYACSDTRRPLDRLGDPQEGDADLGLDARRFLGFNPHDEEVGAALGRLPREYLYP